MGFLSLSNCRLPCLDASTLIYSVETRLPYWPLLEPLWERSKAGSCILLTSELSLMETLVKPIRDGDTVLVHAYEEILHSNGVRLIPASQDIWRKTAQLRAKLPSLRMPDALHAATAIMSNCDMFITNDVSFRQITELPLLLLKDLAQSDPS